jgi:hypothetical protein
MPKNIVIKTIKGLIKEIKKEEIPKKDMMNSPTNMNNSVHVRKLPALPSSGKKKLKTNKSSFITMLVASNPIMKSAIRRGNATLRGLNQARRIRAIPKTCRIMLINKILFKK